MICKCELKNMYNKVFDEKGEIKICGREACKLLIKAINEESSVDVGNPETGMMNVDNLKTEYRKIMEKNCECNCEG